MRSKRWLLAGSICCVVASSAAACGNTTFTSASESPDASSSADSSSAEADGADGAVVTDARPGASFCGTNTSAIFCADFEEGSLQAAYVSGVMVPTAFSEDVTTGGGLTLSNVGHSSSNALEATLRPISGLISGSPVMAQDIATLGNDPTATRFTFSAQFLFNSGNVNSTTDTLTFAGIQLEDASGNFVRYGLGIQNGELMLEEYIQYEPQGGPIDLGPVPSGPPTWTNISFTVELGANPTYSTSFGGSVQSHVAHVQPAETQAGIGIGPQSGGDTPAIDVNIDDVLLLANDVDAG